MRLHCESGVQERPPWGKAGAVLPVILGSQLKQRGGGLYVGWPRLIVPVPAWQYVAGTVAGTQGVNPVCGFADTKVAPVGSWAMLPSEPFGGPLSMNGLAKSVMKMTLDAARTTVVPLPVTSQAKPTRGEKFLRFGLPE